MFCILIFADSSCLCQGLNKYKNIDLWLFNIQNAKIWENRPPRGVPKTADNCSLSTHQNNDSSNIMICIEIRKFCSLIMFDDKYYKTRDEGKCFRTHKHVPAHDFGYRVGTKNFQLNSTRHSKRHSEGQLC